MMIPGKVIVTHVTAKSKLIQCVRTKKRNPDSESLSDKSAGKWWTCKILPRGGDLTPSFYLQTLLSAFREANCQEKRNEKYLTWKIQREKKLST